MKGADQLNFHADDPNLGPTLISIKDVTTEDGAKVTHVILRLCIGTFQQVDILIMNHGYEALCLVCGQGGGS